MSNVAHHVLRDKIVAALPQTQCEQCGYKGCAPYADAVAIGVVAPDQCLPGGAVTTTRLRRLLGGSTPTLPLPEILTPIPIPSVARIRDDECIGCTKCLDPCPVDAIIGAAKQMHTVIEAECTGCGLCVAPCPVDCIDLMPRADLVPIWPSASSSAGCVIAESQAVPCTECGACIPVCPENLRPERLLAAVLRADRDATAALELDRCTDCNACQEVCPSRIPLTAYFAHAKQMTAAIAYTTETASRAADRYINHRARKAGDGRRRTVSTQFTELEALTDAEAQREIAAVINRAGRSRRDNFRGSD